MLCFKLQQNRIISGEFDFWRGEGGGRCSCSQVLISIIIGKHVEMLCIKFQQNRTLNEEFDFFERGEAVG